jgi:hypothetical protein
MTSWRAVLARRARGARHNARWASHNTRAWLRRPLRAPTRGDVLVYLVIWAIVLIPAVNRWVARLGIWGAVGLGVAVSTLIVANGLIRRAVLRRRSR